MSCNSRDPLYLCDTSSTTPETIHQHGFSHDRSNMKTFATGGHGCISHGNRPMRSLRPIRRDVLQDFDSVRVEQQDYLVARCNLQRTELLQAPGIGNCAEPPLISLDDLLVPFTESLLHGRACTSDPCAVRHGNSCTSQGHAEPILHVCFLQTRAPLKQSLPPSATLV